MRAGGPAAVMLSTASPPWAAVRRFGPRRAEERLDAREEGELVQARDGRRRVAVQPAAKSNQTLRQWTPDACQSEWTTRADTTRLGGPRLKRLGPGGTAQRAAALSGNAHASTCVHWDGAHPRNRLCVRANRRAFVASDATRGSAVADGSSSRGATPLSSSARSVSENACTRKWEKAPSGTGASGSGERARDLNRLR